MKKGTFGEKLRREREMRGVALEEIASATRISTRFLEALEAENWDRLPGGIFNRGFVRQVARFLGLDEEALVAEYALVTNDRPAVAVWADTPAKARAIRRGPLPWLVITLLVAMAAGAWFAYQEAAPLVAAWRAPLSSVPKPGPPAPPSSIAAPATQNPPDVSPPQAVPASAEPLDLKIETSRATQVTVIADGKTVFSDRMSAGQKQRFQARERFEISAGNSTAVLVELNGQTVLLSGAPGEPGTLTLTHKDVKKSSGGLN